MNAAQMVEEFLKHRRATERFCAVMPDEQFGFKAWEGALSFGALAVHLTTAADWFLSFLDGVPVSKPHPEPATAAEIRSLLAKNTESVVARMSALTDLERTVEMRGQQVPVWMVLSRLREHEAHHKGQMMQMLRMVGVNEKLFYTV
jgi:uncharacterized damage-inducible protein DinB